MELSTNLLKLLARAGYQKPDERLNIYTKMVCFTLLMVDFKENKIRITQWFLGTKSNRPPLIWNSDEDDISNIKNINDLAALEASASRNGTDLWKGQSIEKLIPQLSFARNLEFKL